MKIVATISTVKFLIEATDDEIAKVAGFQYHGSTAYRTELKAGVEIKISESWQDLAKFRSAKREIEAAAETLRACASLASAAAAVYVIEPTETPV